MCAAAPYNRYRSTFYLVCEFCEHDLAGLLNNRSLQFSLAEIKNIMQQLLNGLFYIHANKVLHRDMKASNILITKAGVLKLADFGLSRNYSISNRAKQYTNRVVTLWYRPPELLLGAREYGPKIDMWGVGCIMAEMWLRRPLMQGRTEQNQLELISQMCGSLTPEVWPDIERLELFGKLVLPEGQKRRLNERMRAVMKDDNAVELVDKLLCLDPSKRICSDVALNHDFFWSEPMPADLAPKLATLTQSMFELNVPRRPSHQARQQQPRPAPPPTDQHFERIF